MLRTLNEIKKRQIHVKFLPTATLEEREVALWLLRHRVQFMYLAEFPGFRRQLKVDFLILGTAPRLVLEVLGDKWHGGRAQMVNDRRRKLLLTTPLPHQPPPPIVIDIWGHDIVEYPGHPVPTDASFDRIMRRSLQYLQASQP